MSMTLRTLKLQSTAGICGKHGMTLAQHTQAGTKIRRSCLCLVQVTKVKLAQKQKEGIAEARSGRRQPVSVPSPQGMPSRSDTANLVALAETTSWLRRGPGCMYSACIPLVCAIAESAIGQQTLTAFFQHLQTCHLYITHVQSSEA